MTDLVESDKFKNKIFVLGGIHTPEAIHCLVPRPDEVLGWRTNEWIANPLGPEQTSALQIKTRSA